MISSKQPPGWGGLLAFGVVALLVIATVPYGFPMQPVVSDSYIFGYNNRIGVVLFLLLTGIVGWSARGKRLSATTAGAHGMPRWLSWGGAALATTLCYGMYRLTAPLNGFAESTYFIQRLHLLAANRLPYRDFEFAYGAALLYLPLWTARLFHLALTDAYYLVWGLCTVSSVILLFETIRLVGNERQDKAWISVIFCVLSFLGILNTGLNYVLLRFVLPVYFAALVAGVRRREGGGWKPSALAVLATVILLLISPELAVAFAMASLVYFAINTRLRDKPAVIALGALTCCLAALFMTANALGVFSTLRAFSTGGNNFPIYISPSIAIVFAATCTAFVYVAQQVSSANRESVFLYLIVLGTMLIPAALGRCDFGHVLSYALPTLLATGLLISASNRGKAWIRIGATLFILFVEVPVLSLGYIPLTAKAAARAQSGTLHRYALRVLGERGVAAVRDSMFEPRFDSSQEALFAPFSYRPNGWGAFQSPLVEYGYYHALTNVLTRQQVEYKVSEMQRNRHRTLLLPHQWANDCVRTPEDSRALLTALFQMPYIVPPQHEMNLYEPICGYIHANYHYVPPRSTQVLGEYELWARNGAE